MRTIYIEPVTFRCHTTQNEDGTLLPYEVDFFEGKSDNYIEGYMVIPSGASWTRSDGVVFTGEMIAPWKPFSELDAVQRQYERQLLAEYAESLKTVGVVL